MITLRHTEVAKAIVQDTEISGLFLEMGSGPVVQSAINHISGASRVIQEGGFPNSKESQERIGKPGSARSVSYEAVRAILEHKQQENPDLSTILVSSWQIPSGDKKQETHGWVGLKQGSDTRYYHLTLTQLVENTRSRAESLIALAGMDIVLSKAGNANSFVGADIVRETVDRVERFANYPLEQYEFLPSDTEHILCIDTAGRFIRPQEFLRGQDDVCIFKGSFNPVTIGHVRMAEAYEAKTGKRPVFAISVNTVDKGVTNAEEIRKRIALITNLGYTVMVFHKGIFVDNTTAIRELGYAGKLSYLCGADTKTRITEAQLAELREEDVTIYAMERTGHASTGDHTVFADLEWDPIDCSSTRIRNRDSGWEELLPESNRKLYVELF